MSIGGEVDIDMTTETDVYYTCIRWIRSEKEKEDRKEEAPELGT